MPIIESSLRRSILLLLILASIMALASCVPPEPKKAVRQSCLDCHPDYGKRFNTGVVHQPVSEGKCNTCHRTHGQVGGAFLREEPPELCFRCHRELENSLEKLEFQHSPVAKGDCKACHSSHNAANQNLLPEPGERLCFSCHSRDSFKGRNIHKPVTQGCATCHLPHGSATGGLLVSTPDELCASCHDSTDRAFIGKHGGFPVTKNCLECHSVHTSDQEALLKKVVHEPVAGLECGSCHRSPQTGSPALVANGADLCYQCHDEAKPVNNKDHEPFSDGQCLDCHSPHASDFTGMVTKAPELLCFQCHEFDFLGPGARKPGKGSAHTIVAEGGCQSCHVPHQAAAGQVNLLKGPAEDLCQSCHAEVAAQNPVNHPPVQEGKCLTCHRSHESEVAGVLIENQLELCAKCHDSIAEDMGRLSIHRPFTAGQCSACHSPHGASVAKLLVGQGAQTCDACHQKLIAERQQGLRHNPFTEGECVSCHAPHSSDQPGLLTVAVGPLCLDCHDDKAPANPARNPHENCTTCHAPHGNEGDHFLLQDLPGLCLNCHEVDKYWQTGIGHQPAMEGECTSCHDPHFADTTNMVTADWGKDLCGKCHDVTPATLKGSHQDILPGAASCRTCHDPHGGPDETLTYPIKHEPFAEGECITCHTGGA